MLRPGLNAMSMQRQNDIDSLSIKNKYSGRRATRFSPRQTPSITSIV
jgi:hypothetical protein